MGYDCRPMHAELVIYRVNGYWHSPRDSEWWCGLCVASLIVSVGSIGHSRL